MTCKYFSVIFMLSVPINRIYYNIIYHRINVIGLNYEHWLI